MEILPWSTIPPPDKAGVQAEGVKTPTTLRSMLEAANKFDAPINKNALVTRESDCFINSSARIQD
ncbi:hypothetical protein RJC98_18155 [Pseudomonas allii]|uniref:Uncharacterized protein n=1 Tax=Pseudomonas allii TaxID=2740531 RepID=A0ACC6LF43_9PSED|nr:hypothetical protein [Pseudomonas allii]MDR9877111.1 hypothetical protein [Pseudomonas allii]